MRLAYVDTSCLVAVAFGEPGHRDLVSKLKGFDRLISSNLLEAEFRSAMSREEAPIRALELLSGVGWVFPDRALSDECEQVLAHGYLRGADLWHLASALYLRQALDRLSFVTLDDRQARFAEALDLTD